MGPNATRKLRLLAICAVSAALVLGAAALADVTVYKNDFSSRKEAREVERSGGKRCDRDWRKKSEVIRLTLRKPPDGCSLRPPVEGDEPTPDHIFEASGKVTSETSKLIRDKAYVSISVRVGGGKRIEFRVFPKKERFQLKREPVGGPFPVEGQSNAIRGIDDRNELRLKAVGSQVRAVVNGTEVADVNDPDPGQVDGQKLEFTLGSTAGAERTTEGNFASLKVSVPNP